MSFSLSKWVCPPPETLDEPEGTEGKVEWFRCLPYIIIHLLALVAFFYPVTTWCLVIALISYSVRMFSITAFYHRYFPIVLLKPLGSFSLSVPLSPVALDKEAPFGGQLTIADTTAILTPKKMYIPHIVKVLSGATPFGL